MADKLVGNDVSQYQGDINYNIYKDNSNFIIVKSSEGVGYTDPKFYRNQSEARRVGLPLGYYHFARPDLGNTPEAEANWFLSVVGIPKEGEIYCLDFEVAYANTVNWCKAFLDRCSLVLNGNKPLIYLNQSQASSLDWKSVVDTGYGLWIAAYTYDPNNNNFNKGNWPFAAMQQWTSSQQVPGISGNIDGNVFFGDVTAFKRYGYKPLPPSTTSKSTSTSTSTTTLPPIVTPPPPPPPPPVTDYKSYLIEIKNVIDPLGVWWHWLTPIKKIKAILTRAGFYS